MRNGGDAAVADPAADVVPFYFRVAEKIRAAKAELEQLEAAVERAKAVRDDVEALYAASVQARTMAGRFFEAAWAAQFLKNR